MYIRMYLGRPIEVGVCAFGHKSLGNLFDHYTSCPGLETSSVAASGLADMFAELRRLSA